MDRFYKSVLQEEFARRATRNPRYSLRAFARALKTDHAWVSRVLADQTVPSWKRAQSLLQFLELDHQEQQRFMSSIAEAHRHRNLQRLNPAIKNFKSNKDIPERDLTLESFRVIADWYHYAILELTYTSDFKSDAAWIAKKLGISVMEAKLAVERLKELELLEETKGKLRKSSDGYATMDRHVSTPALRRRQRQILEKAIQSLENDPIEKRNTTAMCMAIDPDKLPEAKKMIREFEATLCEFLESGKRKQVYEMSVSLFPLTKEA